MPEVPQEPEDPGPEFKPFSGDLQLFPGSMIAALETETESDGEAKQSPGIGINFPGRHHRAGDRWWVLSCGGACDLSKASLSVQPITHGQYDGPPLLSQGLVWAPLPAHRSMYEAEEEAKNRNDLPVLILMFKPREKLSGLLLKEGPVKTWLSAANGDYPHPEGGGSMETLIEMGKDEKAVLRPVLQAAEADSENTEVIFELTVGEQKQRFDQGFGFDMGEQHALKGPEYLLWAGDLDGDGRLDLLMNFDERGVDVALLAKEGELVGEAGRLNYWDPSDSRCYTGSHIVATNVTSS